MQDIIKKEDYIGYDVSYFLSYLNRTYKGSSHKRFLLLWGKPGTGKTTLISVLQNEENIKFRISNASDTRKTGDITEKIYNTSDIDSEHIGIVYDECDGLPKPTWKKIEKIALENPKIPVILIANDISKIPKKIIDNCISKEIKVDRFKLLAFTKRINTQENLGLTDTQIDDIVDQCTSFRGVITLLKWGYNDDREVPQSQQDQILNALHGEYTEFKPGDLRDVITVMHDNVKSPELISQADIYYKRYETGYPYGRYIVNACLNAIRSKRVKLDYPRTYSLIYNARNKKSDIKEKNGKKNLPNIEITGLKT